MEQPSDRFCSPVDAAAGGARPAEVQPSRPRPGAGPPLLQLVLGGADGPPHVHARHLQQRPASGGRLLLDLR